jgi:exopolysaccharide biosynthesis protein
MRRPLLISIALLCLFVTVPAAQRADLGSAEQIADGVLLYRLDDATLLDPPGQIAVQAVRVDPAKTRLEVALAQDRSPARETVAAIAQRHHAIVAINAGFFALENGAPQAILKSRGRLIGGSSRARGAVAFADRRGDAVLLFDRVTVDRRAVPPRYQPRLGSRAADWSRARDIISGAGLLRVDGREMIDWSDERLSDAFATTRHPRTMIGVDRDGAIWLVTVDGRQPWLSLGMTFTELQRLSDRLALRSALNLDGGGSTTMVLRDGWTVNHPSDATGPRPVSDAIVVLPRS